MFGRWRKHQLYTWSSALLLLLILCGCGGTTPLPAKGEKAVTVVAPPTTPTPTPIKTVAAVPVCNHPVCLTARPFPGGRPFIDTLNNIHLAQVFSYNMNNAAQVAKYYDFVWGADPATIPALRAGNPNILLSYYMTLNRDTGFYNNQDAAKQHSLGYWKAIHPDWILYKCDRTTPAYEIHDPIIPFDMTNNAFIDWQVQTYAVPASENGYDAIAADNMNLDNAFGACGSYHNGQWVQRYTGQSNDPQWKQDMVYWATQMQQKLHALPHPLALIPNLGYFGGSAVADPQGEQTVQQIVDHVDGILDESGFTRYGQGYLTDDMWVQSMQLIKSIQAKNKPYYIIDEFQNANVNRDDSQWAIASYLMCKDHLSAMFYSGAQQYGSDLRHPEYNAPIGMPISDMYQDQNLYWRMYSNGLIIANPSSTQTFTVTLKSTNYVDLYGKPASQTFTMAPHSGMILLKH